MQLRQLWLNWWWVVLSVPHDNKGDLSLTPQVWVDAFFSPYLWIASPHLRESKTFLYSGFHAADSRYCIPVFDSGTCILDSSRYWDSGLLELFSGFHKQNFPGLQIPQAKNFLDSGIRNPFFFHFIVWDRLNLNKTFLISKISFQINVLFFSCSLQEWGPRNDDVVLAFQQLAQKFGEKFKKEFGKEIWTDY